MSRRGWVLLVAGLLLATVTYLGARRSIINSVHSNDEARLRAMDQRIASLEARLRARSTEGAVSAGSSHWLVPAPPAAAEQATEPHAKAKIAGPIAQSGPADEAALQRQYFGDLDVRLASEPRDPVWSAETEEKLRSVHELRPRISVENARCGQTMCRVETRVVDTRDDAAAVNNFISSSAGALPEAVVADGEAPGHHIVYFARKGAEFPPMIAPEATAQQ
jgi:hypothetical protein